MQTSFIFAMHAGENHNTIPLATARISLEAHFAGRIKKCSDKVTELCKLEKQTWQTVDELNEKCEAMMNQVDTTAEKQVPLFFIFIFARQL